MPVLKCSNDKWRIGTGPCMYTSKASAERAYQGYLGSKHSALLESIDQLETKCAGSNEVDIKKLKVAVESIKLAIDYQEYKKKHPETQKTPSDPMFGDASTLHGHLHQYADATKKAMHHWNLGKASKGTPLEEHHNHEANKHNDNAVKHIGDAERVGKKMGMDKQRVHDIASKYVDHHES